MTLLVKDLFDDAERLFSFHSSVNAKPKMEKYGYSEEKMAEGKALYLSTREACNRYATEYGVQLQASAALEQHLNSCRERYSSDLDIARFVFNNRADAQSTLELNGRRKHSFSGAFSQMVDFYDRLTSNAAWVAEMGKLQVTPEMLNAQKAELAVIRTLKDEHSRERGDAKQAILDRDGMLDKLNDWVADYVKVAGFAFAATPKLLEGLKKAASKKSKKGAVQRDDL
jgi:hypothetical protein